jgi:hypothetical protein
LFQTLREGRAHRSCHDDDRWAAIIAAALIVGSLPLFLGLAVVLPVLGHASWHIYRKVVV